MANIQTMRIVSVNDVEGIMTVRWNDDDDMEWNHDIPLDINGDPLQGDDLSRHLVSEARIMVENVLTRRAEEIAISLTDYSTITALEGQTVNVAVIADEFEV